MLTALGTSPIPEELFIHIVWGLESRRTMPIVGLAALRIFSFAVSGARVCVFSVALRGQHGIVVGGQRSVVLPPVWL